MPAAGFLILALCAAQPASGDYAAGAGQPHDPGCFGRIPPADSIPALRDGPHVFWEVDGAARAIYLLNDPSRGPSIAAQAILATTGEPIVLGGFAGDTRSYVVGDRPAPGPAIRPRPDSICAVGDLHGEHDDAVRLLRGCGVTDEHGAWAFGRGQLVFCGDVFDRGPDVTDCLWWIRALQRQARAAGGEVHYLLGNHEHMALNGDERYVACTSLFLSAALDQPYAGLFGSGTELGGWLREQPAAIRLGDLLFVHGGLSPAVARSGMTLAQINDAIRRCLDQEACPGDETADLLFGSQGPLWYRGYFTDSGKYARITPDELTEVLARCEAGRAIVGHTRHDWITPLYGGRVLPLNVTFAEPELRDQCLLILGDDFYRAYGDGTRDWLISTEGPLDDRLAAVFDSQAVAFVVYDPQRGRFIRHDPQRCAQRFSPCSTFKIPNTLIGLETGVIPDAEFRLEWDPARDPRQPGWPASWAADHDLASAMRNSVVWFYREIARRVGAERYRDHLARYSYGNQDITGGVDGFWLANTLAISADEQIRFLERFYRGELGASASSTGIVKRIIVLEDGDGYRLSGKTGAGNLPDGRFIGWLVGYVERGPDVYFFALNLEGATFADVMARRHALARAALAELGLLPAGQP